MPEVMPYLIFDGNCADALQFYAQALGARIEALIRGADTPIAAHLPPEHAERVMHGRLALPGGGTLYAGDCQAHVDYLGIHGVRMTLNFDSAAQATGAFNALAEGAEVTMPLQQTFWATVSGMLTDRFGVPWLINGARLPSAAG
jgi:PhnB protein